MAALLRVMVAALLILSATLVPFATSAPAEASAPVSAPVSAPASAEVIDTGYRPWIYGFSFQNSGDPEAFYGADLGALLGPEFHDEIFRHTGHCYGMASASIDAFMANRSPAEESLAEAMPGIDRIQTEQSFYYIAQYIGSPFGSNAPDNRAEYEKIVERLASGRPAVIGVYYSGGGHPGHAVVAYRADITADEALLSVYDPNLPPAMYAYEEAPLTAVYDLKNGSFRYDNGQPFDRVRLNDIDATGIAGGRAIVSSAAAFPGILLFLLIMRRFPPGL